MITSKLSMAAAAAKLSMAAAAAKLSTAAAAAKLSTAAAAAFLSLLVAGGAVAQPVRPNILVIFDTSSSMNQINDTGTASDGSPLCGGIGDGSDPADSGDAVRRTYSLKKALRETLTQVGTDEANFGLARFPQLEDPTLAPVCPTGRYYNNASTALGGKFGCRISTEGADATYGPWFMEGLRQFLLVDVTRRPAAGRPVAADFDPRGANITEIYRWLDQQEAAAGGVITDPELRAGGNVNLTYTPLGRSLLYARLYFENLVKPADPRTTCRKNIVILVTDGAETCDGPGFAPQQATLLFAAGVETYVLTDSATGQANDNIAFFGSGGKRTSATRVSLTDSGAVKGALLRIIAEAVPPAEICNGLDDNCNGKIDEEPLPGVGAGCSCPGLTEENAGRGICKKGVNVCRGAAGLRCDGCVGPAAEVCNGLDDNCNGEVDEGFDLGKACDNGLPGTCKRSGLTVCKPDGSAVMCDAPAVTGTAEVCNGNDDDCDGMVDEEPLPGSGAACGIGLGVCKAGTTKCAGGKFVCSEAMAMGTAELCNGLDDNCNGQVDEKIDGAGGMCGCAGLAVAQLSVGECRPGTLVCRGRMPLDCEGCVLPRGEICDGKDNNCDGRSDEDNPCPAGFLCDGGRCQIQCKMGEFPCPSGYSCDRPRNVCVSLKCTGVVCPSGAECDEGSGTCKDLCADVVCQAPKRCVRGNCEDCYRAGCERPGDICQQGVCKPNPCANKVCGAGEYCDETGQCIGNCPGGCAENERCVRGSCRKNPCFGVICQGRDICDPESGECKTNPCLVKSCPRGQTCVPSTGACKDDPCAVLKCPAGNCIACRVSEDGHGMCVPDPQCEATIRRTRIEAGGAGCACAVPGTGGGPGPGGICALAFALVAALRMWRRR